MWSRAAIVVGLMIVASACDGDDGDADAAVDGGGPPPIATPPDIPWLAAGVPPIAFTPCPPGWGETRGVEVPTCDPYSGGRLACGAGEAHFPGEPSCRPVGDACPLGEYAAMLPSGDPVVHVNAAAAPGGDGSLAAPYSELADVPWASFAPGTVVALAKGRYPGVLELGPGVQVVGACAAETIVTGRSISQAAVRPIAVGKAGIVRNVTIANAPQLGVLAASGRSLTLEGVVVEGAHGFGVVAQSAGTTVTLRDVVIRETLPDSSYPGRGLVVQQGARLEATRLLLDANQEVGMYVSLPGTDVLLEDAVISGTRSGPEMDSGIGLEVLEGARLVANRVLVADNRRTGINTGRGGSVVTLTDVIVRDTLPVETDGTFGRGIEVHDGGRLEGTRLFIAGNRDAGLLARDADTTVTLADTVVWNTLTQESDGVDGYGIIAQNSAQLDGSRLLVAENHGAGIMTIYFGARMTVSDILVRDTFDTTDGNAMSVVAYEDASLIAERIVVSGSFGIGVGAFRPATEITLTDAVVRSTLPTTEGTFGYGVTSERGAHLRAERLVVDSAHEIGIFSFVGSTVELTDVVVASVERSACGCEGRVLGYAVTAASSALSMSRFEVRDAATCGLFLATLSGEMGTTSLDAMNGLVTRTEIGACVQVPGYDLARISTDVEYRDNGSNLDTTTLPVPPPTPPPVATP